MISRFWIIPLEILVVGGTTWYMSLSILMKLLLILWQVHNEKATNLSKEGRYEIADSSLQLGAVTLACQPLINWPLSRLCHCASEKEMAEKVILGLKPLQNQLSCLSRSSFSYCQRNTEIWKEHPCKVSHLIIATVSKIHSSRIISCG